MSAERVRLWLAIGALIAGYFLGMLSGVREGLRQARAEAIRLGHAEWVAGKDGQPVFRWKERP